MKFKILSKSQFENIPQLARDAVNQAVLESSERYEVLKMKNFKVSRIDMKDKWRNMKEKWRI